MKQLFKRTLLAATIAAASGTAVAGNISVATTQQHSAQGLAAVTTAITSSNVTYTLGAAYAVGDLITITVTEGALHSSHAWAGSLTFTAAGTPGTGTAGASMSVGLLSSDANSATYRVTSVTPDAANPTGTTVNGVLNLGTFGLAPTAIAAGSASVTVATKASNGVNDVDTAGTRTGTLAQAKDQFGDLAISTKLDQTIDVSSGRNAFASGTTDTLTFAVTNDTTLLNAANVTETSVVLYGDFMDMANSNFSVAGGGTAAYDDDAKSLTVTYTGAVTTDTLTITPPTGANAVVLRAQDFNVDATYKYGTSSAEVLGTGVDAGAWKLNGAVTNIPYMPYGANVSQILYVTNEGSQSGDITVTAFDDAGNSFDLGVVATSAGGSVTKITKEVQDGLLAAGFSGSGKVSLTVTVNAPEADITVYASYNVGGSDRGYVNSDQYKGK